MIWALLPEIKTYDDDDSLVAITILPKFFLENSVPK